MSNEVIELSSDTDESIVAAIDNANLHGIAGFVDVTIMGTPKSKPRPKFMAWMRGGRMFRRVVNPAQREEATFRNEFLGRLEADYGNAPTVPICHELEAVEVEITFHKKLPLSFFVGNVRESGLRRSNLLGTKPCDTKVPDIDNLAKFVLDALNGVLYADDRQLARLVLEKTYHMEPPFTGKTLIKFKTANNNYIF